MINTNDYSNKNTLKIFQKNNGNIVINTYIRNENNSSVKNCRRSGDSNITAHNVEK